MTKSIHPILQNIIPLVDGIANTFGKNCEVVLHDVSDPQSSIIAIANGHVTGRTIGGPMSEYGLTALRKGGSSNKKVNYLKKTSDGRVLKATSIDIRDEDGKLIGFLCINFDLSELMIAKSSLLDFTKVEEDLEYPEDDRESYGNTVNDVLSGIVSKTLENIGKPVAFMSKEEKVNIVEILEEKGVFLIKGAIDYVAKVLCVSRYTIYNYLDEIRVTE